LRALERQLDLSRYAVSVTDFAIDVPGDTIRYPDLLVELCLEPRTGGSAPSH